MPKDALTPQARHHFTRFDQVDQLVRAREADADLGFMARMMALCSLPRTNPGNRTQYRSVNGPYTLIMSATGVHKLPYGNLPRLILAWVSTEAVRTRSRVLVLGRSLSDFMRQLDIYAGGGNAHTKLRNQMKRLFGCTVSLTYEDEHGEVAVNSLIADRSEFWWNERKPDEPTLWESKIELGEKFFQEIISRPVPIDMNTLTGCVATFKNQQESNWLDRPVSVSCNHPEQLVDEVNLLPNIRTVHPPRLPLPDHVHGLVSRNRSPRRVEFTKALLGLHASFDRSMILLQNVVQVLNKPVAATASQDSFLFTPEIAAP